MFIINAIKIRTMNECMHGHIRKATVIDGDWLFVIEGNNIIACTMEDLFIRK